MTMSIRKHGQGWDIYPAVRFHWTEAATSWADEVGPLFDEALKTECPVNTRPHFTNGGRMRESIRHERATSAGESMRLEFTAHTPYAGYVLHGTTAHEIRAVNAMLHWWDRPMPGREYFAHLVHHPGQRANHFPDRAMATERDELSRRFADIMRDHLNRALEE